MQTHSQNIDELLRSVSYFSTLPHKVLTELGAVAIRRAYRAGEFIFWAGEPALGLYIVAEGSIKISRLSEEGREQILHLANQGETFNDVAALDGGPNPATTSAHTDASTYLIPRADLQRIAERHPQLAWTLIESIARRTRHLVNLVEDLSMHSVQGRLARLLLEQARANEAPGAQQMLTQEEMAAHLGTVREMVGRSLRRLAAEEVIEFDRHRIKILDPERLQTIANS